MEQIKKTPELLFALIIRCNEMPIHAFASQRLHTNHLQKSPTNEEVAIYALEEEWQNSTDLERSNVAMDVFFLVILSECLGFKVQMMVRSSFAEQMDALPLNYSRCWKAAFDALGSRISSLD